MQTGAEASPTAGTLYIPLAYGLHFRHGTLLQSWLASCSLLSHQCEQDPAVARRIMKNRQDSIFSHADTSTY